MTNSLITGLPRSGTTMLCYLLNKLPNSVALDEPLDVSLLKGSSGSEVIGLINDFFQSQREMILASGTAISKSMGGRVISNPLSDIREAGFRKRLHDGMTIAVDNVDSEFFDLYIKHPAAFSALLPTLSQYFCCFACIRNPLAVLLSWSTAMIPVTRGRAPAAECIDPELGRHLDATYDVLDRQLILLDFFFRRYADCNRVQVLRYEDVIASFGRAVQVVNPKARRLNEPLVSRNMREIHNSDLVKRIVDQLLASDNACWIFYSREDILSMLIPA
jgi:hypothetical protein